MVIDASQAVIVKASFADEVARLLTGRGVRRLVIFGATDRVQRDWEIGLQGYPDLHLSFHFKTEGLRWRLHTR